LMRMSLSNTFHLVTWQQSLMTAYWRACISNKWFIYFIFQS
jgi:hypothetical protein